MRDISFGNAVRRFFTKFEFPGGTHPLDGKESLAVVGILATYFVWNLLTGSFGPTVWPDEAMTVDPAWNLAEGRGLVSTAWYQPRTEMWTGWPPLHQILLAGWFKVFGFGMLQARSLNYAFICLATAGVWIFAAKTHLVMKASSRLMMTALIPAGYGISFMYRSGRPDCLSSLLVALAPPMLLIPSFPIRLVSFLGLGFVMGFSLLETALFCAVAFSFLLAWSPRKFGCEYICLALGGVAGMLTLWHVYQTNGVLAIFLECAFIDESNPNEQLSRTARLVVGVGKLASDPSSVLLFLSTGYLAIRKWQTKLLKRTSGIVVAFGIGAFIPLTAAFFYDFPVYYTWMFFMPVTFSLFAAWDRFSAAGDTFLDRRVLIGLTLAAFLVGLPARTLFILPHLKCRNYDQVHDFVRAHVAPGERIAAGEAAYYAVRERTSEAYFWEYPFSTKEAVAVSKLVIHPDNLSFWTQKLGGEWRMTAQLDTTRNTTPGLLSSPDVVRVGYVLTVYERVSPGTVPSVSTGLVLLGTRTHPPFDGKPL